MRLNITIILTVILLLFTSFTPQPKDFSEGRYKNICKDFKNNTLVYLIFVDSKETAPWTEFDIRSTLDSLRTAIQWLESQARNEGIEFKLISDYFIGEEFTTINRRLPEYSVEATLESYSYDEALEELSDWGDKVAREAGSQLPEIKKDGITKIEQPRNKERLIAYMRDKNNVESVALLFMLNNYFKEDISIPVNIYNDKDVEFALVSYKYPSEIAHNILHLFGASDLHETVYRQNKKNIDLGEKYFPNDIMQDPYAKKLKDVEIGPLTKYLIGWTDSISNKYKPLLKENKFILF